LACGSIGAWKWGGVVDPATVSANGGYGMVRPAQRTSDDPILPPGLPSGRPSGPRQDFRQECGHDS
jgi:hypothetical protein